MCTIKIRISPNVWVVELGFERLEKTSTLCTVSTSIQYYLQYICIKGNISSPQPVTLPLCLSRPVTVRRHVSWRLAAWGIPLPCNIQLLAVQRARTQTERKRLSRSALHRQNLAKARFYPAEKCYGHFKQPCQRLYNY